MIRILQISDIHWTKRRSWNADFKGMKATFLKEMEDYRDADGRIDYVFICGDIAFKGAKDQYDEAQNYIKKICDIFGLKDENVYVVPGNHDVNRKSEGAAERELINAALAFGPNNNSFLDDVILKNHKMRKTAFTAFKGYYEFSKNYLCHEEVMGKCLNGDEGAEIFDDDKLFYQSRLDKKVGDVDVSIRGVNTALNCDGWDWNEEHQEWHKQMLPRRAYTLDMAKRQEIRIIMGHHPLEFLTNKEEVEDYLNKNYHIQLFGHVHFQYVEGDNYVRVLSGAFDPPIDQKAPDKYRPVFNIIEIDQKDNTHIIVRGTAQIWDTNQFVDFEEGCFEKEIEIERNVNKWKRKNMSEPDELNNRNIKFKYMRLDNRTSFFDKIAGVDFTPSPDKIEYDNCLDFADEVERQGKLAELNKLIS